MTLNAPTRSVSLASVWFDWLLIAVIGLPLLLINLNSRPYLWFDEGYKLNGAYTLAVHGVYGTLTSNGFLEFDPGTSSGPVDMGLTALVYRLFGAGILQARLVSVAFALTMVLAFYAIARRSYARSIALAIIILMLVFPAIGDIGLVILGRQVLSETPALALIVVGLLIWLVKGREHFGYLLVAGVITGAGLLSKTQMAIPLLPAVGLMILLNAWKQKQNLFRESLYPVAIVGTIALWMLVGKLATTPEVQAENSLMLADAIRTNLLTGLFGRTLPVNSIIMSIIMLIAGLYGIRHLRDLRRLSALDVQVELSFGLLSLTSLVWFVFFSVGWPRYGYFGLILATFLIGKLLWDAAAWVEQRFKLPAYAIIGVLLTGSGIFQGVQLIKPLESSGVEEMAAYVQREIPADAVIETWEWELDPLIGRLSTLHHPHQRYLFEAIRQFSHTETAFDLQYDVLQANPDYLIIGSFAEWTHIYPYEVVEQHFEEVAQFGIYTIYERKAMTSASISAYTEEES